MATSSAGIADRTIFVAIDFGTTFSGIAWAAAARPETQNSIIQWPDAYSGTLEGVTSEKVPTELIYEADGLRWGFQIKDREQRHQWFKLSLDPQSVLLESGLVQQYPDTKSLPPAYAASPEQMCTDFLKALRKHTFNIISHKLSSTIVETTAFAFIITVPALWKDGAKEKTRRCAREAGMGENVKIITEPEAAAIHALDMMDPHGLEIGQAFIVCDCGGGTVDLITYEIVELKPMLKVREATSGTGGVCGSSILNRIFQKHLEDRFKGMRGWDEEVLEEAMEKFEKTTKRNFGGSLVDEYVIPVNGLRDNVGKSVKRGRYRMTGRDLVGIFAPVVSEITKLVQNQVDFCVIKPEAILLVGGFGANSYLREQLKTAFPNINVMQPANGWTAVSRGALTKAIAEASTDLCKVNVTSRIARKYYGITCATKFEEDKHESWRKYWSDREGTHQIEIVKWVISKGDVIEESTPVTAYFHRNQPRHDGPFQQTKDHIFSFDDGVAPMYKDHNVKHLATLTADLSSIPSTSYQIKTGADGEKYYEIDFQIKATFFSAHTEWTLWFNGKSYGSVQAEYV